MSTFIDALRTKDVRTENGMVTNSSSLNSCLDLFFSIGAMRSTINTEEGRKSLIAQFEAAKNEDPLITRKIMYWARDIRQGAGEREAFRVLLKHCCHLYPKEVIRNLHLVSEYGRWDDIFVMFGTPVESDAIKLIVKNLEEGNGLLAKWMPRTGGKVSSQKKLIANKVRASMNMSPKEFRKYLVNKTKVIETAMCSKDYSNVRYETVPSLAMARYQKAFMRNDTEGFSKFKDRLLVDDIKINAGAIYPYDILKTLKQKGDEDIATKQWESLPNFMEGCSERILPVCDVSGSMCSPISSSLTPMDVCISLGLYISERNEGPFKNAFISFSESPVLQYLTGDLKSRYRQLSMADWGMSTNLQSTFDLILNQAIKNGVTENEMSTTILIMSDMEFNEATGNSDLTAFEMIEEQYQNAGYKMPKIIFWNLSARSKNFPVQKNQKGAGLISGFSPSILKSILNGKGVDPIGIMLDTLNSPRYEPIQ
jgi:hypothetical protein